MVRKLAQELLADDEKLLADARPSPVPPDRPVEFPDRPDARAARPPTTGRYVARHAVQIVTSGEASAPAGGRSPPGRPPRLAGVGGGSRSGRPDDPQSPGEPGPERAHLVTRALGLSYFSVIWGTASGRWPSWPAFWPAALGVLGGGPQHAGRRGRVGRAGVAVPGRTAGPRIRPPGRGPRLGRGGRRPQRRRRGAHGPVGRRAGHGVAPRELPLAMVSAGLAAVVLHRSDWSSTGWGRSSAATP